MNTRLLASTALTLALSSTAMAQTKWDLPAAYPATNFHTENLVQFANDVDKATGGKLKITVHANASLFKANEIKRAVQGGQAQIGEVLLVNFENENAMYGADGIPFLATSYAESKRLSEAQKPFTDKLLAATRHLCEKRNRLSGRHARFEVARLQPRHRQDRRADWRPTRDHPGR